jgi:hypothetical protein
LSSRRHICIFAAIFCLLAAALLHAGDSSLYVKVQLEKSLKTSTLKPGDIVTGKLGTAVYSGDRELLPGGSVIHLKVNELARRRRPVNDHWPWVVQFFTPRYEKYPLFSSATVTLPNGTEIPLHTSVVFFNREVELRAHQQKAALPAGDGGRSAGPLLVLEASLDTGRDVTPFSPAGPVNLEAGTSARIVLMSDLSAKKNRPGDSFQARLIEPVRQGDQVVLPEGSVLSGEVTRSTPPRWLSRAGSINLKFTGMNLPGGSPQPVAASLSGAHLARASRTRMDTEGGLRADRPGKAWIALNLGASLGIGKVVDDGTQLLIEALVSTATDVSTAGAARVASTCVSGVFLLTRHGRDVILPKYTELEIVFERPAELPATSPQAGP